MQRFQGQFTRVWLRHRDVAQPLGRGRSLQTKDPPTAIVRQPEHGGRLEQLPCTVGQQLRGHLRGVHPDLQHRIVRQPLARIGVRVGKPGGEVLAALLDHGERRESFAELGDAGRLVQIAGEGHHPRGHRRRGHRVQGVEQGGSGNVRGEVIADRRRQAGLRTAGLRRLGHHQHGHRQCHEITFQKSTIAVTLPRSDPLTFDLPPVRGP